MDDELPVEDYTDSVDMNFEGVLYKEASGSWSPPEDIDWDLEIDVSEEDVQALADAATQFHYSNISHLMLCGRLLERGDDIDLKKLALYLAFSKMRNVDAWGRYLAKMPIRTDISPHTKEYFSEMYADEDLSTLLIGMAVLGGTVGYGVLDHMRDSGEPIFEQIADHIRAQKRDNEELLVNYLGNIVEAADEDEMDGIREQARFYRDRSEKIVMSHSDLLETLGHDPEEVAQHVLDVTDEFYGKIGVEM